MVNPFAVYITRSDIAWYSFGANAFQKPQMLSQMRSLILVCPEYTGVPETIFRACRHIVRIPCGPHYTGSIVQMFLFVFGVCRQWKKIMGCGQGIRVSEMYTGFDFPSLFLGYLFQRVQQMCWTVFCWDPPVLARRDDKGFSARIIIRVADMFFCWLVRSADKVVLNIHPGLFDEIGCRPLPKRLICSVNGVYFNVSESSQLERIFPSKTFPLVLGVVSVATEEKGVNVVQRMAGLLADRGIETRVDWFGDSKMSVLGRIHFKGCVAHRDIPGCLAECSILLHSYLDVPSLRWNYSLKILEYMCSGRPIIASALPGVRSVLRDGENALLVSPGCPIAFADAVEKLFRNPGLGDYLAEQARKDVSVYAWEVINRKMMEELSKND